jgi:hypothetical protein
VDAGGDGGGGGGGGDIALSSTFADPYQHFCGSVPALAVTFFIDDLIISHVQDCRTRDRGFAEQTNDSHSAFRRCRHLNLHQKQKKNTNTTHTTH